MHSSHFQHGFIQCQFTSLQLNVVVILELKQPIPPSCYLYLPPKLLLGCSVEIGIPLLSLCFTQPKKPTMLFSLLVRQASLSLSHLGSPHLCLLQAKSILFGCWWPEACTALLEDICRKRRIGLPQQLAAFPRQCLVDTSLELWLRFPEFVTPVSPPSISIWLKHPWCSLLPRSAPSPGYSWTPSCLCLHWYGRFMLLATNTLFFHTGSHSLGFKVLIFYHTVILLSSHCQMNLSHWHISLAYLELLKNTDLVSWRYEA